MQPLRGKFLCHGLGKNAKGNSADVPAINAGTILVQKAIVRLRDSKFFPAAARGWYNVLELFGRTQPGLQV